MNEAQTDIPCQPETLIDTLAEKYNHIKFYIDDDDDGYIRSYDSRADKFWEGDDIAHTLDIEGVVHTVHPVKFRLMLAAFRNTPVHKSLTEKAAKLRKYIIDILVKDNEKPKVDYSQLACWGEIIPPPDEELINYHNDLPSDLQRLKKILKEHPRLARIIVEAIGEIADINTTRKS